MYIYVFVMYVWKELCIHIYKSLPTFNIIIHVCVLCTQMDKTCSGAYHSKGKHQNHCTEIKNSHLVTKAGTDFRL